MAKKTIQRSVSEDFSIHENGSKVGTVRIKPNGVLWKPKGKHTWFRLTVEQFATLAEKHGEEVEK